MKKINIGFIGCGSWSQQTYIPFFKQNPHTNLVSVSGTSNEARGKKIADQFGFSSFYKNWKDMVENENIDLVVISTPHIFHYEQIKFCLQHGLHVQVDKPPVLHFNQITELIELAEKKELQVNVHSQRRFYEEYGYAKKQIEQGKLGKIEFVQGEMGQQLFDDFLGSWRSNPKLAGGGIMFDSGYHLLDSILFMIGNVLTKSVNMTSNNGNHQSDTYANLTIKTTQNCVITINVIRGMPQKTATERIQLVGTKGWILISRDKRIGKTTLVLEHYAIDGNEIKKSSKQVEFTDKLEPLKNLIDSIQNNSKLESGLKESAESIKILEAGYESVLGSKIITFVN
jgi:predicted dehydrogenase